MKLETYLCQRVKKIFYFNINNIFNISRKFLDNVVENKNQVKYYL